MRTKILPFLPGARGLEKGSAAPIQLPSAGIDNGRGFPEGNRVKVIRSYIKFGEPMFIFMLFTVEQREKDGPKYADKIAEINISRYFNQWNTRKHSAEIKQLATLLFIYSGNGHNNHKL